ncbi:MAG: OsmC family protein [Sedimentisphaerales bacterium]|nr:OsmC family protein [Sedimentisphaerales bacterium]
MEIFKNTVHKDSDQVATTVMSGIRETKVGPPLEYGGAPDALNPEEMLVASVNSCIMLVFYHFADKYKVDVASYHSDAEGKVEKTKNGLRFTNIEVKAKVRLGSAGSSEKIEQITQLAEKYCLVSGSLTCPVQYTVEVAASEEGC